MEKLTKKQIKFLKNHKSIHKVTDKQVAFSSSFKISAVKQHYKGTPTFQIFAAEGFDLTLFSSKFMTNALLRWRHKFESDGESGLEYSKRGRKAETTTDTTELSYDQLLARIEYLEQKVDFLKKLKALKGK